MAEAHAVTITTTSPELGIATTVGSEGPTTAAITDGGTLDTKHPDCGRVEPQLLCLPHVEYSLEEMNALYPPFIAPPAVDAGDPHNDHHETLLHEGYRLAREIARDASVQGRRRQMR